MAAKQSPIRWRDGMTSAADRILADEVPVAVVVNGTTVRACLTPVQAGMDVVTEGLAP